MPIHWRDSTKLFLMHLLDNDPEALSFFTVNELASMYTHEFGCKLTDRLLARFAKATCAFINEIFDADLQAEYSSRTIPGYSSDLAVNNVQNHRKSRRCRNLSLTTAPTAGERRTLALLPEKVTGSTASCETSLENGTTRKRHFSDPSSTSNKQTRKVLHRDAGSTSNNLLSSTQPRWVPPNKSSTPLSDRPPAESTRVTPTEQLISKCKTDQLIPQATRHLDLIDSGTLQPVESSPTDTRQTDKDSHPSPAVSLIVTSKLPLSSPINPSLPVQLVQLNTGQSGDHIRVMRQLNAAVVSIRPAPSKLPEDV